MKKLLVAVAVATLSVLPAASASAASVDISNSDQQSYNAERNEENNDDYSLEAYSNKTVSYQAFYYVNYEASMTDWIKQMRNTNNSDYAQVEANSDTENYFRNGDYGY